MKLARIALFSLLVTCFPGRIYAQNPVFETEAGVFTIFGGPVKSSHIGAFDIYVGPAVASAVRSVFGGGKPGSGTTTSSQRKPRRGLRMLLPDGKLPDDFSWSYQAMPGFELGLSLDSRHLTWFDGSPLRFSAFIMRDQHRLRMNAPSGFGVLIDPTTAMIKTNYRGIALEVAAPLLSKRSSTARHVWSVGVGAVAFRETTIAQARSAFLDITATERRSRVRPLISSMYQYVPQPSSTLGRAAPFIDRIGVTFRAFPTDHFWTVHAAVTAAAKF